MYEDDWTESKIHSISLINDSICMILTSSHLGTYLVGYSNNNKMSISYIFKNEYNIP